MPYKIIKQMDGQYTVRSPSSIHARGTTLSNAKKQRNLLNAVEHGWKPTRRSKSARKKGMRRE